jgi:isocitrate lyase
MMGCENLVIARTDSESGRLISSAIDVRCLQDGRTSFRRAIDPQSERPPHHSLQIAWRASEQCGHLAGKVLVPMGEHINRLVAARFQWDMMGCENFFPPCN